MPVSACSCCGEQTLYRSARVCGTGEIAVGPTGQGVWMTDASATTLFGFTFTITVYNDECYYFNPADPTYLVFGTAYSLADVTVYTDCEDCYGEPCEDCCTQLDILGSVTFASAGWLEDGTTALWFFQNVGSGLNPSFLYLGCLETFSSEGVWQRIVVNTPDENGTLTSYGRCPATTVPPWITSGNISLIDVRCLDRENIGTDCTAIADVLAVKAYLLRGTSFTIDTILGNIQTTLSNDDITKPIWDGNLRRIPGGGCKWAADVAGTPPDEGNPVRVLQRDLTYALMQVFVTTGGGGPPPIFEIHFQQPFSTVVADYLSAAHTPLAAYGPITFDVDVTAPYAIVVTE